MILKIAQYYIRFKDLLCFALLSSLAAFGALIVFASTTYIPDPFIIMNLILSVMIILSWGFALPSKSEIDFVLSTPADPRSIFAGRFLAITLFYLSFLTSFSFPLMLATSQQKPDLLSYISSIILSTIVIGTLISIFWFLKSRALAVSAAVAAYLMVTAILCPSLNMVYGLVYPSSSYATVLTILIAVLTRIFPANLLQEYYAKELYTNAYGLLEEFLPRPRPAKAPAVAPKPMSRSLWRLAWRTTFIIVGVKEILAILAGVAAYSLIFLLHVDSQELAFLTWASAFLLLVFLWNLLLFDLRFERLWISFSADRYAYVRWRTVARSLASLLATSPWIVAYMAVWLLLDHLPAAYAAASLVSASLAFPILAWLIAALSGEPQIRKYGLVQRPVRYRSLLSPLLVSLTIGLYLAPVLSTVAGYSAPALSRLLEASAAFFFIALLTTCEIRRPPSRRLFAPFFFLIALFTRWGRRIWDRLIYRLTEVGYV